MRRRIAILGAAVLIVGGALFMSKRAIRTRVPSAIAQPDPGPPWEESFDTIEDTRWIRTCHGDFGEKTVDVRDGRLRLRCATIGTDEKTVKFLGARTAQKIHLSPGTRISAEIDWNNQANGCYLSAGLVLTPAETDANPLTTSDWLKIEFVGVPPGKTGRLVIASRAKGRDLMPYTEGWPQSRREGRPIGLQKVEIVVNEETVEVWENGARQYVSKERLFFDRAHLYLQISSHSNYPPREVFFDNIRVVHSP